MGKPAWKKLRPESNPELEDALNVERNLTARWYERMSGVVRWTPGERERLNAAIDAQARIVNNLMKLDAAEWFAKLPSE